MFARRRYRALLGSATFAIVASVSGRAAADAAAYSRLPVVIYPPVITNVPGSGVDLGVTDIGSPALADLAKAINKDFPLFNACVYLSSADAAKCDPASAAVVIYANLSAPAKSDPAGTLYDISVSSLDTINQRGLTTLALGAVGPVKNSRRRRTRRRRS